jgi:hypothetical protein
MPDRKPIMPPIKVEKAGLIILKDLGVVHFLCPQTKHERNNHCQDRKAKRGADHQGHIQRQLFFGACCVVPCCPHTKIWNRLRSSNDPSSMAFCLATLVVEFHFQIFSLFNLFKTFNCISVIFLNFLNCLVKRQLGSSVGGLN